MIVSCIWVVIMGTLAVVYSNQYLPALADWYVRMAVPYGADAKSPLLARAEFEDEPYLACARQVVKQLRHEDSTAIFPPLSQAKVTSLGGGGFLIRAHVDEDLGNGRMKRSAFSCTVRMTEQGWLVERVEVGPTPGLQPARTGRIAFTANTVIAV